MSTRFEGCHVSNMHTEIVPAGTEVGEDVVTEGALVLSYDEVFYIEGDVHELLVWAESLVEKLDALANQGAYDPHGGQKHRFYEEN